MAALTDSPHSGQPINLRDFVDNADWINRAIPTFDQISFGLRRLVAAGLLVVEQDPTDGLVLRATAKAIEVRRLMKSKVLGSNIEDIDEAIKGAAGPKPEPAEDRSLGRLPGLSVADLDTAVREHGERIEHMSKPYVAIAQGVIHRQQGKS